MAVLGQVVVTQGANPTAPYFPLPPCSYHGPDPEESIPTGDQCWIMDNDSHLGHTVHSLMDNPWDENISAPAMWGSATWGEPLGVIRDPTFLKDLWIK